MPIRRHSEVCVFEIYTYVSMRVRVGVLSIDDNVCIRVEKKVLSLSMSQHSLPSLRYVAAGDVWAQF